VAEFFDVQNPLVDYGKSQGWLVRKVVYQARRGAPDLWFLKAGTWVLIEAKKYGADARIQQKREHERLRRKGANVYVVDTLEEGKRVLDAHDSDSI
jgi:hypothetical protein